LESTPIRTTQALTEALATLANLSVTHRYVRLTARNSYGVQFSDSQYISDLHTFHPTLC
jgi:hypothetical protein